MPKHFGPEWTRGLPLRRLLRQRGILGGELRAGGPGRPPFWRTLVSPVSLRGRTRCLKNKHSHTLANYIELQILTRISQPRL